MKVGRPKKHDGGTTSYSICMPKEDKEEFVNKLKKLALKENKSIYEYLKEKLEG